MQIEKRKQALHSLHVCHERSSFLQCSSQPWSFPWPCPPTGRQVLHRNRWMRHRAAKHRCFRPRLIKIVIGWFVHCEINQWALAKWLTNCADDASVARHSRFRVNIQQTHVLKEGVRHGSMHLLAVDDGRARILWLRHDWIRVCRKSPGKTKRETREVIDLYLTALPVTFHIGYREGFFMNHRQKIVLVNSLTLWGKNLVIISVEK